MMKKVDLKRRQKFSDGEIGATNETAQSASGDFFVIGD